MKTVDVLIARIYVRESSKLVNKIEDYLIKEAKIRGVSVFRAIAGMGGSGQHAAALIDLSLDLPLIVEFFDEKTKIEAALEHLNAWVKAEHILFWEAKVNEK